MYPSAAALVRRSFRCVSLALVVVFAACGDDAEHATLDQASPDGAAAPAATHSPAASAANSAPFELRISGGAFAGTHQLADNVTCTVDPGTWMVTSSRPAGQGLTQVLLMIDGVQPTGGSSREMSLMAHFGDPMGSGPNSGTISLDPAGGEGTGSATVRRDGRGAVIEVEGTTSDGAQVSAVARCASVAGLQ